MDVEAGKRLKAFVHERMADEEVGSLVELADRADVAYDTLHVWFRGRVPTPGPGGRVASVLGVTYRELLAAREERKEAPPGLNQTGLGLTDQTTMGDIVNWLRLRLSIEGPAAAAGSGPGQAGAATRAELDTLRAELRALRADVEVFHAPASDAASPKRQTRRETVG